MSDANMESRHLGGGETMESRHLGGDTPSLHRVVEFREAIENPFGARSISAIKYRAWATTGRCNGGYCLTRIVDMLIHEYGVHPDEITYRGSGSELFSGEVK